MKATFTIHFGKNPVTIEGEAKSLEGFWKAYGQFFDLVPTTCQNCKKDNLAPCYRNVKSYEYYSVKCHDCQYEFQIGQLKEGGFFPKEWAAPYQGEKKSDTKATQSPVDDDIGF